MKKLQLIDRVVVEIRGEEGEKCSPFDIAQELRKIADRIDDCIKGDNELRTNPNNGQHTELLWERECTAYGFRMGNKSLIGMHYYGSEKKPKPICVSISTTSSRTIGLRIAWTEKTITPRSSHAPDGKRTTQAMVQVWN